MQSSARRPRGVLAALVLGFCLGLPCPAATLDGGVAAIVTSPDGKVLLGGRFRTVDGLPRIGVARLLADGSVDPSFDAGREVEGNVSAVALQKGGRILVGGVFTGRFTIIGLLSDGTPDPSFVRIPGYAYGPWLATLPDDRIAVGYGVVLSSSGTMARAIGEQSYTADVDSQGYIVSLSQSERRLVLIDPDHGLVPGFASPVQNRVSRVPVRALDAGGYAYAIDQGVHILDDTGSVATSFRGPVPFTGTVYALAGMMDGSVVIGGLFTQVDGLARTNIARILPDGSLDPDLGARGGASGTVSAITATPDGDLLVGGSFRAIDETPGAFYLRLPSVAQPGPTRIALSRVRYEVGESETTARIDVRRLGEAPGQDVRVSYSVLNGDVALVEAAGRVGTVEFRAGDPPTKVIELPLRSGNERPDGSRSFRIQLENPQGVVLVPHRSIATVAVLDDEAGGLVGRYYSETYPSLYSSNHLAFSDPAFTRIDRGVQFRWDGFSPGPGILLNGNLRPFSVRWRGELLAPVTGTYRFLATSDDGIRVWVNGQPLIQDGTPHPPKTFEGAILLEAGHLYPLAVDYFEIGGGAVAQLEWAVDEGQVLPRGAIPPEHLLPTGSYEFAADAFFVDAAGGFADVTVEHIAAQNAGGSVRYRTIPGPDFPGTGFPVADGRVVFAPGQPTAKIRIPVPLPVFQSSTFGVELLDPEGGRVSPHASQVSVNVRPRNAGRLDLSYQPDSAPLPAGRLLPLADGAVALIRENRLRILDHNGHAISNAPAALLGARVLDAARLADGRWLLVGGFSLGEPPRTYAMVTTDFRGTPEPVVLEGSPSNLPPDRVVAFPDGGFAIRHSIIPPAPAKALYSFDRYDASMRLAWSRTALPPSSDYSALVADPQGRLLIAGSPFEDFDGRLVNGLVRILADGRVDPAFSPTLLVNSSVSSVFPLDDGGLVIRGNSLRFPDSSLSVPNARLLSDGTRDTAFTLPPAGQIRRYPDGRWLVFGTSVSRLLADGRPDPSFDTNGVANGSIADALPLEDGGVLISGSFNRFDGVLRPGLARLQGDATPDRPRFGPPAFASDGTLQIRIEAGNAVRVRVEESNDLREWRARVHDPESRVVKLVPTQGSYQFLRLVVD